MVPGKLLKADIAEFGREHFQKEILFLFDDYEAACDCERDLITKGPHSYNLAKTSSGGVTVYTDELRAQRAARALGTPRLDMAGENHYFYGKTRTDHSKFMKGKINITNGRESKRVPAADPIPMGWWKGMPRKKDMETLTPAELLARLMEREQQKIPARGERHGLFGQQRPDMTGRIAVTNGLIVRKIRPSESIPQGWWRGSPQKKSRGTALSEQ